MNVDRLAILTVGALVACGIGIVNVGSTLAVGTTWTCTLVGSLLGMAIAQRVLRSNALHEGPYRRSLLLGLIAGPVGAMMLFGAEMVWNPRERIDLGFLAFAGGLTGIFLGPLFAIVTIPLTLAARDWRKATALDTLERALSIYGLVLLVFGLGVGTLQALGGERGWDGPLTSVLAAVFFLVVFARDVARSCWLKRVVASAQPGWSMRDLGEGEVLPSWVRAAPGPKVLTRALAAATGPFRGSSDERVAQLEPVAALRKLSLRAVLSGLAAMLALGLQIPLYQYRVFTVAHTWERAPLVPTPVRGLEHETVTALASSNGDACARVADGTLRCWGRTAHVLTTGNHSASRVAEPRPGLGAFDAMALGERHMCVVRKLGESRALCWGENVGSELAEPPSAFRNDPIEIGPPQVIQLAMGGHFTLALTKDGEVHSWGPDPTHVWGNGAELVTPARVDGLASIIHVAAAGNHACAIDKDGAVFCWGEDSEGQSSGTLIKRNTPVKPMRVEGIPGRATTLALNANQSWARLVDGTWWSWGAMYFGDRSPLPETKPRLIPHMDSFKSLHLGASHICALADDGSVTCWGQAGGGRLGDGSLERSVRDQRSQALPPGSALELSGGDELSCARGSRIVWCWGGNG